MGRLSWRVWWTIGLLVSPSFVMAQESCIKLVFDRFCLGGDVNQLLSEGKRPQHKQEAGERVAYVFREGRQWVYVLAYRDRIYKVLRAYGSATQLGYDDLYVSLRDKYGVGEDRSRFPADATTASRRLASIRRGDGRALHRWSAAETWLVELSWTREMGIALSYIASDLDQAQKAAAEQEL